MKTYTYAAVLSVFLITAYTSSGMALSSTHLIDTDQNQALIQTPRVALELKQPSSLAHLMKLAKVHFIAENDDLSFTYNNPTFSADDTKDRCSKLGFKTAVTSCTGAGQIAAQLCPYDFNYTNSCCDKAFKYSASACSYPKTISSASCGGKFKCYCDRTLYPYDSSNCKSPNILVDSCKDDSGTFYAQCSCPSSWVTCDKSVNQIGSGTVCREKNKEDKYASCACSSSYKEICTDFGPSSPMDYCFLKGTKYYKTCKTEQEVCEGLGYTHSLDNPCDEDSIIDGYCPKGSGNSYFSCKVDVDKYCQNRGYSKNSCGAYQVQSSETCDVPGYGVQELYKKCNHTCKSRLAEQGYKEINEGQWYKDKIAVVLKDIRLNDTNSLKNPLGTYYDTWRGEAYFNKYEGITECSNTNRPRITFVPDVWLFNNNLDNITAVIDHSGTTGGETHTYVEWPVVWRDIVVTETNTPNTNDVTWKQWVPFPKKATNINITGRVVLKGNNTFTSDNPSSQNRSDHGYANNHKTGFYYIQLDNSGNLEMDGSQNTFQYIPILVYSSCTNNSDLCEIKLYNKARLEMPYNGIAFESAYGYLSLDTGSSALLYALRVRGRETARHAIVVANNSLLSLVTWLRLENARIDIRDSSVTTQDPKIEIMKADKVCLGYNATLRSNYKPEVPFQSGFYEVRGPAAYRQTLFDSDIKAGQSEWNSGNSSKIKAICGYYGNP